MRLAGFDLRPLGVADLAPAGGGEDQKLEWQHGRQRGPERDHGPSR